MFVLVCVLKCYMQIYFPGIYSSIELKHDTPACINETEEQHLETLHATIAIEARANYKYATKKKKNFLARVPQTA